MKLIRQWSRGASVSGPSVVCIGVFDGLHLGHQALLNQVLSLAESEQLNSAVLTFEPSPRRYFAKKKGRTPWPRLMRFGDKYQYLAQAGLNTLCALVFDEKFSALSGGDFSAQILKSVLNARHVVVGYDFRFGQNRSSGVDELRALGLRDGFAVHVINPICMPSSTRASSTALRKALDCGDFSEVEAMLGRAYAISGMVKPGDGRGRQIGTPTANIHIPVDALPLEGVYTVTVDTPTEKNKKGVANIGKQPTFNGEKKRLEVHLFDFDRKAYGERWIVSIKHRIRGVKKFDGVDQLIAQINNDKETGLQWFDIDKKNATSVK